MPTKEELKEAAAWLERHESELPKMTEGERINGDPVIFTGKTPPDFARRIQPHFSDEQEETIEAIHRILLSIGFTPRQLIVLKLRCEGYTQGQIADGLKTNQQEISRIGKSTLLRIAYASQG